ncbi:MAG: RNB domain-containing ribonuclease [Anaerolineaceae bacterium]|nr:RNB domain-containing ribonuclease [Anaerolineaceae bacterium]
MSHELNHRTLLTELARLTMLERGLLPEFSTQALAELEQISAPATRNGRPVRDLRELLWSSIDNDDSHDLDQLTAAQALPGDCVKILVAIADVDALVSKGSAIDEHARYNTTSVYTAAVIFSMLPEKLSTNLTSLNPDKDRLAVVTEMIVNADGSLQSSKIYPAMVYNHAQLTYVGVSAWLNGTGGIPPAVSAVGGLAENLHLQDKTAQHMKHFRHTQGALSLETIEARPLFKGDQISALEVQEKNRAREIIEDFMIMANGAAARFLAAHNLPSIRRIVRIPKRWDRIVEIAAEHGFQLPDQPSSSALEAFLHEQKTADPLRFPDLSLAVIKLMGAGEYAAIPPDEQAAGHFGLAVKDYAHSTAPNRRFPDLITQRLLKAALTGAPPPYDLGELDALAKHCTRQEDAANKVERQVEKSAAALLLESRIGERFNGIITGASPKGTWVRLFDLPVEGKVVHGFQGLDVGQRVRVELIYVDIEKGYIDFKKDGHSR